MIKNRFINANSTKGITADSISNNNRCTNHRTAKTMLGSQGQVRSALISLTPIQGSGICKKGFAMAAFYILNNSPDKKGGYKSSITFLPKVKFYGNEIIWFNPVMYFDFLKQCIDLIKKCMPGSASQIRKEYVALHKKLQMNLRKDKKKGKDKKPTEEMVKRNN